MCFLGTFSSAGKKNERGGETERLYLLIFGALHLHCKWHWGTTSPKCCYEKKKKKKSNNERNNQKNPLSNILKHIEKYF